jgi:uncharacterized protein
MALTQSTPGVYIEEISTLPPSVAAVGTAIPAFIGYTQNPGETSDGLPVPVRVGSLLEYESIFGFAPNQEGISATVTGDNIQVDGPNPAQKPKYLMYYSLQMYFANGGGPCYIASVGDYSTGVVDLSKLQEGLAAIEKQDEPTLLVFPDAKAMSETHFYTIYKSAIEQCHKLQDRFTIMDTYNDNPINSLTYNPVAQLRNGINLTTEYLKYSAAYYPFLRTIISYHYADNNVGVTLIPSTAYNSQVQDISEQISSEYLGELIDVFVDLVDEANSMLSPDALAFKPTLVSAINSISTEITNLRNIIYQAVTVGQVAYEASNNAGVNAATNDLKDWIDQKLIDRLIALGESIDLVNNAPTKVALMDALSGSDPSSVYQILEYAVSPPPEFIVTQVDDVVGDEVDALISALNSVSSGATVTTTLAAIKNSNNILYNQIKAAISQLPLVLPPSSAMAGVYARVDNNNGVWTAPANVGLNYVIEPTQRVDNTQQEDLNVTTTGKSVNAIRTFTGRGTLVWGARTMAGNDNEWRYISVRRFFNFVEESIQKASEPFVFQPNDANTWVKLRAMIENFLNLQWRAGALTGAKPEQAFYVRVGLGQTMTAQDILEGRMIIEIGLAAVRPAEFIVLKFSHKMQEA